VVTDLATLPVRTFTIHPPTHAAGRVLGAHATAEDAARVDAALRVVPRTTDKAVAARLGVGADYVGGRRKRMGLDRYKATGRQRGGAVSPEAIARIDALLRETPRLSYQAIADVCGVSHGYVGARCRRGRS
jgi:hypothetical protein